MAPLRTLGAPGIVAEPSVRASWARAAGLASSLATVLCVFVTGAYELAIATDRSASYTHSLRGVLDAPRAAVVLTQHICPRPRLEARKGCHGHGLGPVGGRAVCSHGGDRPSL